ncbi:MAG: hypothetical protein J6574_03870 [Gilliamella sp.]|nr:hypothetical protein [Gilliamella sp.]
MNSIDMCDVRYNASANLDFEDFASYKHLSKKIILSIEYTFTVFSQITDKQYKNQYNKINYYYKMFKDLLVSMNEIKLYKDNKYNKDIKESIFEQYEKIFTNIIDEIEEK